MDLWQHSGYHLLDRAPDGHLLISDDYLRLYYARPELAPVVESCAAELRLHQALLDDPRRPVPDEEIAALADPDAQETYRVMLRFRDRLRDAPTLESCYFSLFQRDVAVPPLFIYHTAEVILRGMLVTAIADMQPAIERGIAIVKAGGVCVIDARVLPGYDGE